MPLKQNIKVLGGQTRLSDIFQRAGEENLFGYTNILMVNFYIQLKITSLLNKKLLLFIGASS